MKQKIFSKENDEVFIEDFYQFLKALKPNNSFINEKYCKFQINLRFEKAIIF